MDRSISKRLRNRHFFALDLALLAAASYFSFVVRLERVNLGIFWPSAAIFTTVAILITPFVFRNVGIYSRYWRYASIDELMRLTGAVVVASLASGLITWVSLPLLGFNLILPRSIPLLFSLLALILTAAPRLAIRVMGQYKPHTGRSMPFRVVAIMGAGDAGAIIVRELQNNPQLGLEVAGFLDDDLAKHDVWIHDVPVLGDRHDIPRVVRNYNVDQIIIAMPTASGRDIRDVVDICEEAGVETKIIPGIYELLDGTVSINQLRDVDIEDLLRREPIKTDIAAVEKFLRGKRILITGGGGSIGSELCRQILRCQPEEIILLGHGENSIFEIYHELKPLLPTGTLLTPIIADIRFPRRINKIFQRHRPHIVFHTAAHKHVPLMEDNPSEAVTNNVQGTLHVLSASKNADVEQFVMVSTDKAVNPTSIMGSTKRVAELLVHRAARETGRPYVTVRFGNVLGSRGSVILTFKKQIAKGGPVTVTHPEMKRYFMTIPEAVQLLLQATVLGEGGEVFMLDMGEPVKIEDLARDLIELSGLEVGQDIEIRYTGTRPGEKLFEELFVEGEIYHRTKHEQVFIASNASSFVPPDLEEHVQKLVDSAEYGNRESILAYLHALVPEYGANGSELTPKSLGPGNNPLLFGQEIASDGA